MATDERRESEENEIHCNHLDPVKGTGHHLAVVASEFSRPVFGSTLCSCGEPSTAEVWSNFEGSSGGCINETIRIIFMRNLKRSV